MLTPDAPTRKTVQYYAMLGTRAHLGRRLESCRAFTAPISGKGHFDKDEWQLYQRGRGPFRSQKIWPEEYPEKLKHLINAVV